MRCSYTIESCWGLESDLRCWSAADEDTGLCPRHAAIQATGFVEIMVSDGDYNMGYNIVVRKGYEVVAPRKARPESRPAVNPQR